MLPPRRIFISYRHEEGKKNACQIKQSLEKEFGPGSVFLDVSGIEHGVDFKDRLEQELSDCEIVLVIIGPRWLKILKERLTRKQFDHVRVEVSRALKQAKLVVPILLGNARIPSRDSLPTNLKELSLRNALAFGVSSRAGLAKLIAAVRKMDDPTVQFDLKTRANAFEHQKILQHAGEDKNKIARKLAGVSKVSCLDEGAELYSEEGMSHRKFLFFVFSGCIHLTDKGDLDFHAGQHEMMGEFPMLLGRINYSVKATATCETVYARISPSQFCAIADAHPELWRGLARMLAERLDKANAGRARRKTIPVLSPPESM